MTRLTIRRLEAIQEALIHRVSGEIDFCGDDDCPRYEDYEAALDWVSEKIAQRKPHRPAPQVSA